MIEIENSILAGLLHNEEYMRRVAPFLDESYFFDFSEKTIYNSIISYINSYNGVPTKEALHISMGDKDFLSEDQFNSIGGLINSLSYDKGTDIQWLLDETEKFCKQRALHIAVHESILVLNDKSSSMTPEALPELLQTALGVSFDQNIGHDFLEVFEDRYQFYHTKEDKVPFDIDIFNKITKGGLSRKSLSVILAGTGVGKLCL